MPLELVVVVPGKFETNDWSLKLPGKFATDVATSN